MWIVCITSVRHVLTVNGYGGRQTKENEKSWCFKGWETLVIHLFAIKSGTVASPFAAKLVGVITLAIGRILCKMI